MIKRQRARRISKPKTRLDPGKRPAPPALSGVQLAALAGCLTAGAILAGGYFLIGSWWMLLLTGLVGLGWLIALAMRKERLAAAGFILFTLVTAAGIIFALPPAVQFASLLPALAAWDLGSFANRLDRAARVEKRAILVRRHAVRLLAVLSISLILGAGALGLRLSLSFIPALLLAGLLLAGLIAAIAFLRRRIV